MEYKILITLLLFGLTALLWSQDNMHSELEKRLVSNAHGILLRLEAEKQKATAGNDEWYIVALEVDSIAKYDTLRNRIITRAQKYLGVRYRYGQANEKGFDCSGFVKYVFGKFGIELPRSSYTQFNICKQVEIDKAKAGDLVFFNTRGRRASHVGIYMGNNKFIHSPSRGRTVSIDSISAYYFKPRLSGFGSVL